VRERKGSYLAIVLAVVCAIGAMPTPAFAQASTTLPTGTVIPLRMENRLSSNASLAGDKFTATTTEPVRLDRRVVIPAGSRVEGHVTAVEKAKRLSRAGTIAVEFDRIVLPDGRSLPIVAQLTSLSPDGSTKVDDEGTVTGKSATKRNVVFIGGGAGVGAVIGAVSGSAGVGTGIGAGIGTAAVLMSKGNEAVIEEGFEFGLELLRSLSLPASGAAPVDTDLPAEPSAEPAAGASPGDPNADPGGAASYESEDDVAYAQDYLRNRGLYTGPADGRMTEETREAIAALQREAGLEPSGRIDFETAREILLVDDASAPTVAVRVTAVDAEPNGAGGATLHVSAETPTGGWTVYESHFVEGDTLHVYVRGVAPSGVATDVISRHDLTVTLDDASGITRYVVHGRDGASDGELRASRTVRQRGETVAIARRAAEAG
jgi:hypothetical protein